MKTIFLITVLVTTSFITLSQKITTKMEWALIDKMINVSEAKKEGFLVVFKGAENQMVNNRVKMGKFCNSEITNFGKFDRELYYFFNFQTKKLTIYSPNEKLFDYEIKRVKRGKNDVTIKIKTKREIIEVSVDLVENKFYEVKYNRYKKASHIQFHNRVYLYSKV